MIKVTMDGHEYQNQAMRTNDGGADRRLRNILSQNAMSGKYDTAGLLNGLLGLSGETGEVSDMVKKWIFHEKPLDEEHFQKEVGDVCWYIALICESMHWDLSEIMEININKLRLRYPDGFDIQHSEHRQEGDV